MHWEDYSRLRGRGACWLSNSDRIETHGSRGEGLISSVKNGCGSRVAGPGVRELCLCM
jgi:hypothetical protein